MNGIGARQIFKDENMIKQTQQDEYKQREQERLVLARQRKEGCLKEF
jgi:hypothetical protein